MPSINNENTSVEIKVLVKKGIAITQQATSPLKFNPYNPEVHTPKFVIIKNNNAPNIDPEILVYIFFIKNLDPRPIKITLPHVKKVTL